MCSELYHCFHYINVISYVIQTFPDTIMQMRCIINYFSFWCFRVIYMKVWLKKLDRFISAHGGSVLDRSSVQLTRWSDDWELLKADAFLPQTD